jgi:hypothetical protein
MTDHGAFGFDWGGFLRTWANTFAGFVRVFVLLIAVTFGAGAVLLAPMIIAEVLVFSDTTLLGLFTRPIDSGNQWVQGAVLLANLVWMGLILSAFLSLDKLSGQGGDVDA